MDCHSSSRQPLEKMNQPKKSTLHTGQFLALIREGHWEYVDRVNASGAAIIVAVTAERKVLLVEQYRIVRDVLQPEPAQALRAMRQRL